MSVEKDFGALSHKSCLTTQVNLLFQVVFHVCCSSDESLQQIAQLSSLLDSTWIVLEFFYHKNRHLNLKNENMLLTFVVVSNLLLISWISVSKTTLKIFTLKPTSSFSCSYAVVLSSPKKVLVLRRLFNFKSCWNPRPDATSFDS